MTTMTTKNNPRKRHLILPAVLAALTPAAARAADWTWNGTSGTWNTPGNWTPNTAPANNAATVLNFGGTADQTYVAQQNIAANFLVNRINFTSSATGPIVVGATSVAAIAPAAIRLGGAAPRVTHGGSGDVVLSSNLQFAADATFDVTGAGRLVALGDHSQTGGTWGLTKTGSGTLVLGYTGTITADPEGNPILIGRGMGSSLGGDVKILEGTILMGNTGGSFLSNNSLVTIAAGATFDFNNNGEDFGSLQGEGTLLQNGANANLGFDNRSSTWAGQIVNTGGSDIVAKNGTGTWTVVSAQPYASRTNVNNGAIVFSGLGSASNTSSVTLAAATALTLDNAAANVNDRLNDNANVIMNGNSELRLLGNAAAPTAETVGIVAVAGLTTVTLQTGAGQSTQLTSFGLSRTSVASVLFRGNNLGGTPGAPDTTNVFFANAPNLVGGGGAPGTTSMAILPYALGDSSPTGLGSSLVTYDPTVGVRALNTATEFASYAAATDLDNVRIAAAATGLAGKAVNALVVHNPAAAPMAVTGAAGAPLVVTSGAVLFTGDGPTTLSGFDAIDFGSAEGVISVAGTSAAGATIAAPITGFAGLIKGGAGTLALTAPNTYIGTTTVNSGTLRVASDASLGDAGNTLAFYVGTLQLAADLSTARTVEVNAGGRATFDTAGHTLTLASLPTGPGTLTKTGAGALVLPEIGTGANLTIDGGTVRVTSAASTGTNARTIVLGPDPTNTIDTNGFDAVVGSVSGVGGLTKTGDGTLLMQGANSFAGDILIAQGTIKINGTAGSFFADNVISTVAAGATLDMSNNSEQWGGIAGAGTIIIGQGTADLHVLGTRDTVFTGVIEGTGEFRKNGPHTLTMSGPSTFTGQSIVVGGTLLLGASVRPAEPSPLGNAASAVLFGETSGTNEAAILLNQPGLDFARPVTVRAGSTGAARLGSNHAGGTSTVSANIALAKSLEVTAAANATTAFTGVLSGVGGVTKVGAGTVRLTNANAYAGPTVVAAGTLRVEGSVTNSASLTVKAGGALELATATAAVKSLAVEDGGIARLAAANAVLTTDALTVTGAGSLDLGVGALIVNYAPNSGATPIADVRQMVLAKRLTSAAADANPSRQLGYAEASEIVGPAGGTFAGQAVDADAVIVRLTLAGDATLDGTVDFSDLVRLAQNYEATVSTTTQSWWHSGDFTGDGVVDFSDLVKLAQNYEASLPAAAIPGAPADFDATLTAAFAAVPEPSSALTLLAACGLASLHRRRRAK
jgi:autotransporter-associated beta strand protein